MSQERLREHFSDLYEGTIDPGLEQQLKARFETDFQLKDDYDHFVTTMFMLGKMPEEQIEVPPQLSSMIADRLAANPKKQSLSLGAFWRNLGFGTLACVAIASAFFAVKNRNSATDPNEAAFGPHIQTPAPIVHQKNLDLVEIKMVKGEATLTYDSSSSKTMTVVNVEDQKMLHRYEVNENKTVTATLANSNEEPAAFQIEVTGENAKHLVIVPGSSPDMEAVGKGDLVTFARLLATKYKVVVHLQFAAESKTNLQWDISGKDALVAASAVLAPSDYSFTMSPDGILNIQALK